MARLASKQWTLQLAKVGLRVVAVFFGAWGLLSAWVAVFFFHIDTHEEIRFVLASFETGGEMLALALILWRIPGRAGSTWKRHAVTIVIALAIYLFVARYLRNGRLEVEAARCHTTPEELLESVN